MKKKILVTLLSFVLVVTMIPFNVFADTLANEKNKKQVTWNFDQAGWTPGMEFGTTTPTVFNGLTIVGGAGDGGTDYYEKNVYSPGTANFYGCAPLEVSETNHYMKFTVPKGFHTLSISITGCQQPNAESWVSARPAPKDPELGYVNLTDEMSEQTMEFNELPTGDIYIVFEAKVMPIKISQISVLYAEEAKVTFDSMGGTSVPSQTVIETKWAQEPAEPTKQDCFFTGWYKERSRENRFDFEDRIEGNTTLYAGWQNVKEETWEFSDAGWSDGYTFGTGKPTMFNGLSIVGGTESAVPDLYRGGDAIFQGTTTSSSHYMKFKVPAGDNINTLKITASLGSSTRSGKMLIKQSPTGASIAEQDLTPNPTEYTLNVPEGTAGEVYVCFSMSAPEVHVSKIAVEYNQVEPTVVPDITGFSCWAMDTTKVQIVWDKSPSDQVQYWIYKGDLPSGDWGPPVAKVTDNEATSYLDYSDIEATDYWFYMMRPVIVTPYKTYFGNYTKIDYAHLSVIDMKGFAVKAPNANSVVVSWDLSEDPSNDYYIYRSTDPDADFGEPYQIFTNDVTSFTDTNVVSGTKYYYKAQQVTEDGGGGYHFGNFTKIEYGWPRVIGPETVRAWATPDYKVYVSWDRTANPNVKYALYRGTQPTGDWGGPIKIFEHNDPTVWEDATAEVGQKYYYMIRGFETISGRNYYSKYSSMDYAWPRIIDIQGFSVYATNAITAELAWNKSTQPNIEYWIYKGDQPTGDWGPPVAKIKDGATVYRDTNVDNFKKKVYFMMRPVAQIGGKAYFGAYTKVDYAFPRVPTPTGFKVWQNGVEKCCYIAWDLGKLTDAQHCLYKSTVPTGDWGPAFEIKAYEYDTCKDADVERGTTYYYMMRDMETLEVSPGVYRNFYSDYTPMDWSTPHRPWDLLLMK